MGKVILALMLLATPIAYAAEAQGHISVYVLSTVTTDQVQNGTATAPCVTDGEMMVCYGE